MEKRNDCLSTWFIYDGGNAVVEMSASNEVVWAWVNGPGLDQPVERIAFIHGTPRNRQVFHADGLGSVSVLTDESGEPVQTYAYAAFGGIRSRTGTDLNRVTFTAREALGDSLGFYYYRNRILDPSTGSFTSEDPLGFIDRANRYVYCANNPVNFVDPLGLATYLYLIGQDSANLPLDKAAQHLSGQLKLGPDDSVVIQHISGFTDFNNALKANKDIARITYLGHGGPGILFLGLGTDPDTNITGKGGKHSIGDTSFESCSVDDLDKSNVRKDAEIYLYSCFSGMPGWDYGSIARSFGQHFGVKSYGGHFGTKFKENGQPYTPLFYINQVR